MTGKAHTNGTARKDTTMARLTDNQGRLLGGLDGLRFRQAPASERSAVLPPPPRVMTRTPLAAQYGPEETVPGLGCSYGALVYSARGPAPAPPRLPQPD